MAKKLIGIDIGTQGTKAALFTEDGECLASAFAASNLHRPSVGIVEEDPEAQFRSVCSTIAECMSKSGLAPDDIAGISIDGQMAGIIGIGEDGSALTPYDSWLDTRCADYIEKMEQTAGDEIISKAGCPPGFNHGPKILWWKNEHPDVYARVKSFVQPGGYAAMRLCGLSAKDAFIDTSYLHFSGYADNSNSRWDEELCRVFDIDMSKLPAIVEPRAIIGEINAAAASECGIRPGVSIIAGCGDTAASFLSCGATEEGICVDVAGTASVFAVTTSAFKPDRENKVLACGQSATPGLWHPYAYVGGGGMNLEWFKREIVNRGGVCDDRGMSFDELNRLAEEIVPDDEAPLFVPHFAGRACPSRTDTRGAWVGLNWSHRIADLYRAALEGVALEYGIYRRVISSLYPEMDLREIRVTGGGEKSMLWNSIKADILATRVTQVSRSEGAPLGSALLAGFGTGIFNDLSTAAKHWITTGSTVKPNEQKYGYYARRLDRYIRLLEAINGI